MQNKGHEALLKECKECVGILALETCTITLLDSRIAHSECTTSVSLLPKENILVFNANTTFPANGSLLHPGVVEITHHEFEEKFFTVMNRLKQRFDKEEQK